MTGERSHGYVRKARGGALKIVRRRQYRNPPIEEATCEVRFAPGDEWNLAYIGAFYEKIKDRFGGKPREQRIVQLEGAEPGSATSPRVTEITKVQFPSPSRNEMVAVGPDMVSIHVMRPYPGWDKFRTRIEEVLASYRQIADPKGIRRIGIRYINRIPSDYPAGNPKGFFVDVPTGSIGAGSSLAAFAHRHEYIFGDEPIRVAVSLSRSGSIDQPAFYLLDIDVSQEWLLDALPFRSALRRIDELRDRERTAFESLITDDARRAFDA